MANIEKSQLEEHFTVEQVNQARTAEEAEHKQSMWHVIKADPVVILLAAFANIGTLMYGYDNLSLSLCLTFEPFQQQFGNDVGSGQYLIPTYWQSLWNALGQVATMIGAICAGPITDRFGRRIAFFIASLISFAGIAVLYTSASPGVFLAGKIVNGIALGITQTTGQIYISETSPLRLRGILLSVYTFSTNLGLMIAASVAFSRVTITDDSSYKVLFAAAWTWPSLLLIFCFLIPESPYWLVRQGNTGKASRALARIRSKKEDLQAALTAIILLNEEERQQAATANEVSYLECFKGTNWRRTRIILYANGLSQFIGATFFSNGPYFLVLAGVSPVHISMLVEVGIAVGILSSIVCFFVIGVVGRRPIILTGTAIAGLLYFAMGVAGSIVPQNPSCLWTIGICLQLIPLVFAPAVGPAYSVAGEISSLRLRAKSQSIGFTFNFFFSTVWNVVVPYMFNPGEGNLGGRMGWIFFTTSVLAVIIIYFEFPETKDRTYAELDEMFQAKVPARKFKRYTAHGYVV